MTAVLVMLGLVGGVIALVLILPCPACKRRRERMKAAYDKWRANNSNQP